MEKYFHVDHTRRNCVAAYTNLVTKSQRHAKSHDFFHWKKSVERCVKNILCSCFDMKSRGKRRKTLGHSTTYLATEIQHFLQTFVILKLFLPVNGFSICCEDGGLLLTLHASHKIMLILVENTSHFLTFLHNSLKQLCWICLVACWICFGGSITWIFDSQKRWCIKKDTVLHVNNSVQVVFAARLIWGRYS